MRAEKISYPVWIPVMKKSKKEVRKVTESSSDEDEDDVAHVIASLKLEDHDPDDEAKEFKEVEYTFASDKKCFTFNYDGKHYGRGITPDTGLTFIVNHLVPQSYADLEPVTVTIHPPGVVPYLDQYQATTKAIPIGNVQL